jgi:putative transposase
VTFYKRNLPHWHPDGAAIFLTWHLAGSLPKDLHKSVAMQQASGLKISAGKKFVMLDRVIDGAAIGPTWLRDSRVAKCVVDTLTHGASRLGHYQLHSYVVMPNHVHMLITPVVPVARVMAGIKGVSARHCNQIFGRINKHFRQPESYDHWVRNTHEFQRICRYIENNPVAAGFAVRAGDWRWSSASAEGQADVTLFAVGKGGGGVAPKAILDLGCSSDRSPGATKQFEVGGVVAFWVWETWGLDVFRHDCRGYGLVWGWRWWLHFWFGRFDDRMFSDTIAGATDPLGIGTGCAGRSK